MSGVMELLAVCVIIALGLIAIDVAYSTWKDAKQARKLNADWEAFRARQREADRRIEQERCKPIEWEDVDGLDTRHLEVKHEVNKGE